MLGEMDVHVTIPVKDVAVAQEFYEQKLGLKKVTEYPGGVLYSSGTSHIYVYESRNAGTNQGTTASWKTDNPEEAVDELKGKGITFEHYPDMPGVMLQGDIHVMGEMKAAWFKDPDGNILCIGNSM